MAVRSTVLKLNGQNEFQIMSAAEMQLIGEQAIHQYSLNPSVSLDVVANSGNLNQMIDRRYQAGAAATTNTGFADGPDVQAIDTVWDTMDQTVASPANTWDDSNVNIAYPLYLNASNEFVAMTRQDFYDTFIAPTVALWYAPTGSGNYAGAGQYAIYDDYPTKTGFTLVSTNPVFSDSISDDSIRTGTIPENPLDQPATENTWYLYVKNSSAVQASLPFKIDTNGDIVQYTESDFNSMLQYHMRYAIVSLSGSQIRYQIENQDGTQGRVTGQGMTDTHYASFDRRTRQVADTYYSQEVPAGSVTTRNTWYLKIVNSGDVSGSDQTETFSASASPSGSVNEGESVTFTLNTNNVPDGRAIAYTISGITADDLSSGQLSGSITISGASGSTSITLANDAGTENETVTCTFATSAGNVAVSVDVIDILEEVGQLEGTVSQPKYSGDIPLPGSNGMELGWMFRTDGKIAYIDDTDARQTVTSRFQPWSNTTNPTGTWYVRCTSRTGQGTIQGGWSLNTWYRIDSTGGNNRYFVIEDLNTPGTYPAMSSTFTFQLSKDQSTVEATGYYVLTWDGGA